MDGSSSTSVSAADDASLIAVKVTFGRTTHVVNLPPSATIRSLKDALVSATGIDAAAQKLLFKGVLKDDQTIADANIKAESKVMMMASSTKDILQVATAAAAPPPLVDMALLAQSITMLSTLPEHKKIIDKGKPADAEPGIKGMHAPLPPNGISGLLNARGVKTRLTFKLELDELWIATNEHTQKVQLTSIQNVIAEPIVSCDEYYLVALQLGPTEK